MKENVKIAKQAASRLQGDSFTLLMLGITRPIRKRTGNYTYMCA